MADEKISGVPAVVTPVGTDQYATNQGGVSKSTTLSQILAAVPVAGDVFKVGTPLINEIGVWTGDGTIRGFAGFEFAAGQFSLPNYSFPVADGSVDQVLVTDAAGVLSFKDQSIAGGLLSGQYRFATSTVAADPGSGLFRYDNTDPALVTEIFIDDISANGVDISNLLALITTNDRLYLQSENDSSQFVVFNVTAPITDNTGWFTITGTVEASGNLHTSNTRVLVVLQIGAIGGGGDVFKVGTPANNQLGVWTGDGTIEGDPNWQVVGTAFQGVLGSGPELRNVAGVNIHPRKGDTDTGIASRGDNRLAMVAQGIDGIKLIGASAAILQQHNTTVGITAFAGGGAGSATQLNSSYSVIDTVATTGDSVKFSTTLEVGVVNYVKNDGANAMDLFPAGGDDLGFGIGVAISVAAGKSVAFIGTVAGSTSTQFIFQEAGASFPLLAPDGTVGAPSYSFSGATNMGLIRLGGNFGFVTAGVLRWAINNTELTANTSGGPLFRGAVVASATVPTIMPNNTDINTGLGWNAADELSLVAGGLEGFRVAESASVITNTILGRLIASAAGGPALQNEAGTFNNPSILPNKTDDDTGIGYGGSDVLSLIAGASERVRLTGGDALFRGNWNASTASGPAMLNEAASATNPTLVPNQADPDTGIGWNVSGELSLIGNGIEFVRIAVGGVTVNAGMTVSGNINISDANGAQINEEAATATNPTVIPNRADSDTGLGGVAGVLSLIQNSIEFAQGATAAAGGLLVNNALTGAGLERALTVSDLLPNDVVQARRTTDFTLTTAFVDVTLDTTDVETDPAIIEHVDLATDNIEVMVAGTYKIGYEVDTGATTTGDSVITVDGRVRVNDTSVLAGSEASGAVLEDGSIVGDFFDDHLSQTFYATLAANDFVTLQLEKVEIGGAETYVSDRILFTVERCL